MRGETAASRLFYTALGVWVPLGLVVPWGWKTPTLRDFAIMASIGILGFLFLLGLDVALDAAPVGRLAPFVLAQPIWIVLIDAIVGGRAPARHVVAGRRTPCGLSRATTSRGLQAPRPCIAVARSSVCGPSGRRRPAGRDGRIGKGLNCRAQ